MLDVQRRAEELRGEVSAHKAVIRARRAALKRAAAALNALEQECRARGVRLIYEGEGEETHGREQTQPSRAG